MTSRRADELERGDIFVVPCVNGRTRARVQTVEQGSEEDWNAPDTILEPRPMVRVHVVFRHPVQVPAMPRWRVTYWTLWFYPDEVVELVR